MEEMNEGKLIKGIYRDGSEGGYREGYTEEVMGRKGSRTGRDEGFGLYSERKIIKGQERE